MLDTSASFDTPGAAATLTPNCPLGGTENGGAIARFPL